MGDLFEDAEEPNDFGPVFAATYACDDSCCGDGIEEGQEIRADGAGGWIHATKECEA